MIKKIICPVDFSTASLNALEYAAKLAQVFNSELMLINVQRISMPAAAVSMGEGIGAHVHEDALLASERLKDMAVETNKMFNISTHYEVEITATAMEKTFALAGEKNVMIVMGTNGIDDVDQYIFGTNTYNVIKKTNCPVFIVPENVTFSRMKKIIFAWDYTHKNKFSFSLLNEFMNEFNPQFVFLHVSKRPSEIGKDIFNALRDEIIEVLGNTTNVEFEQIYSDDVPESINRYMRKSKADMLSITFYNRGLIPDLFHGTVAKDLSAVADYPILVLHA